MLRLVQQALSRPNLKSKLKTAGRVLSGTLLLFGASTLLAEQPRKSASFQIMDDKFKLISKDKFMEQFQNADEVRVVSTIGAIGTGKSTLLNKMFFNNEPTFEASDKFTNAGYFSYARNLGRSELERF
jgi:ATPase subunit of ABC transporter with duplicated ATPase domains